MTKDVLEDEDLQNDLVATDSNAAPEGSTIRAVDHITSSYLQLLLTTSYAVSKAARKVTGENVVESRVAIVLDLAKADFIVFNQVRSY